MEIKKREGYTEQFKLKKVSSAIKKAFEETGTEISLKFINEMAAKVKTRISNTSCITNVEEVQDTIEKILLEEGFTIEAKAFIKHRMKRSEIREEGWKLDELQSAIWNNKYRYNNESFDEWVNRVSGGDYKLAKLIKQKKFIFAGRILAHRGLQHDGKKITFSNCYVMTPPEDNIESIFDSAKELARTYSAGGGCGIDISKLRPNGAKVNNSARTTSGATSFMQLYDLTTSLIGQNGRRGALMISMDVNHPDIEEFIDIKTKSNSITKANISIKITDEFMRAVINNDMYTLKWTGENGLTIEKQVNAREIFRKNAKNNWDWAEAGFLFWDTISQNHMMSSHPEHLFAGVNPCKW